MPEIKRTFTAGKMNKDLDERLVRNGEYRDALNIQVRTTDGEDSGIGNAGTVQNIKGNNDYKPVIYKTIGYNLAVDEEDENNTNITRFLGSVADEKNDKAYFFAAAPWPIITTTNNLGVFDSIADNIKDIPYETIRDNQIPQYLFPDNTTLNSQGIQPWNYDPHSNLQHAIFQGVTPKIWVDSIIELDATVGQSNPIFIDKYAVTGRWGDIMGFNATAFALYPTLQTSLFTQINVLDGSLYKIGMTIYFRDNMGNHLFFANGVDDTDGVGVKIVDIQDNALTIAAQHDANPIFNAWAEGLINWQSTFVFEAERVLEFDYWKGEGRGNLKLNLIPNINIIDDLLLWTDGVHEPKKINIERSKRGTDLSTYATNPQHTKLFVSDPSDETATYPDDLVDVRTLEPLLEIEGGDVLRENITVIREAPKSPPSLYMRNTDRSSEINFVVEYNFTDDTLVPAIPTVNTVRVIINDVFEGIDVRVSDVLIFRNAAYDLNPIIIKVVVMEVDGNAVTVKIMSLDTDYELLTLDQNFWNVTIEQKKALFETKFGRVAYRYKYEDGEYSTYSPWSELAFLPGSFSYTPSQGYNDGMVNNLRYLVIRDFVPTISVRPNDVQSIDILWKTTDDQNVYVIKTITREIDSEWEDYTEPSFLEGELENTGSLVVTSEMIHKVLPTAQLLRGFDNVPKTAVTQEITANRLVYGNYTQGYDIKRIVGLKQLLLSEPVNFPVPEKSVKSIRSYKFGMVFGDRHGRETPVVANGYQVIEGENITGDISVEKSLAHFSNKFNVKQQWGQNGNSGPLEWIDYVKYYVKETSNEYYNLVLDRWYDAGDGNVWLAFPSVDRNKVDEQTYLILKNAHGSQEVVVDRARYKILAIESEAPDFIKTDHRKMGRVRIDRKGVYGIEDEENNTDGVPDGLISDIKLRTSDTFWNGIMDEGGPIDNVDFEGTPKVRIVGTFLVPGAAEPIEAFSPWRTVTRLKTVGGRKGCDIQEVYSAGDVDMFQKIYAILSDPSLITPDNADVTNGAGEIKYFFEFKDEVVENKPQFDGRFFVKILRDEVLSQNVLGIAAGVGNYNVEDTYNISYIANWDSNPALPNENDSTVPFYQGAQNTFDWPTVANGEDVAGFNEANIDSWPNQVPNFGIGDPDSTEIFWEWWAEQVEEGNASSIFIDQVPAWKGYNVTKNLNYIDLPSEAGNISFQSSNVLTYYGSGYTPLAGDNYQPAGLSTGRCTEPNHFGQLTFSSCNKDGSQFQPGNDTIFKAKMQEPGTLFRFQADPEQTVYRVTDANQPGEASNEVTYSYTQYVSAPNQYFPITGVIGPDAPDPSGAEGSTITVDNRWELYDNRLIVEEDGVNKMCIWVVGGGFMASSFTITWETTTELSIEEIQGPIEINGARNFEDWGNSEVGSRHSIITRFGQVTTDGATDSTRGIDITRWDPRGEVKHTGIGSMVIEILGTVNEGELLIDSVATNSACFETEPKENIDVDIYYEASRGIPMYLDSSNIDEYVDPSYERTNACLFKIEKRELNNGLIENVELQGNPWVWKTLGDDCVAIAKGPNSYPEELLTNVININSAVGVSIGDIVAFSHIGHHSDNSKRYGLVTKSRILDHVTPVVYGTATDNIVDVPVPSERVEYVAGNAMNIFNENSGNRYYIDVTWNNWVNTGLQAFLTVGVQVVGYTNSDGNLNVDVGTFVTEIEQPSLVEGDVRIYVNKPLLVTGKGRFDFIETTGYYRLERETWKFDVDLGWFNCYSFGNAVESDRIRDDFNAPQINNGVRASSTFLEYREEHLGSNLIHSSEIFNSTSGVNGLNQFSMAEKITKSLNPIYGSIQRLKTRDTNLVTFCEDKVLKVLASKDALFNADGNSNLTATDRVLGTAIPFVGDYGISKNPESLATDTYRLYFTDKQRGAVLRLSGDGLTPISNVGMKTYFRENLFKCENIIGTYDVVNGEYNVTLSLNEVNQGVTICTPSGCTQAAEPQTVTFNEGGKSWVSFKSFVPACGVSVSGKYFTAPLPFHRGDKTEFAGFFSEEAAANQALSPLNKIWVHHAEGERNKFYDNRNFGSSIEVTFNEMPESVKSFKAVNYEGSQARVNVFDFSIGYDVENGDIGSSYTDGEYNNLRGSAGWYVESFKTDMQTGYVSDFINKENKWFNWIYGDTTRVANLEQRNVSNHAGALNVQGIGFPLEDAVVTQTDATIEIIGGDQDGNSTTNNTNNSPPFIPPDPPLYLEVYWNNFPNGGGQYGVMNFIANGGADGPMSFTADVPNSSDTIGVSTTGNVYSIDGSLLTNVNGDGYGPGEYTITVTDSAGAQDSVTINFNSTTYPPPYGGPFFDADGNPL